MTTENYQEIYDKAKNYIIANQNKITDFNEGSIISTLLESFARILERFYIDTRNGYASNLNAIAQTIFEFEKKQGQKATGKVVFSRANPSSQITVIPTGTKVSSGSFMFVTTQQGSISSNEINSNEIPVQAVDIGLSYNVAANTITSLDSLLPSDIVSVSNPKKCTGGTDTETETEMLARFKQYINGLQGTNVYGLKSRILDLQGVRSVSVDEHFPLIDDIFNATVYVDDGTGGLTPELKLAVEDAINGDDTQVNQGARAAGINIRVLNATAVPVSVNCTVYVYRVETATAMFEIRNAIEEQINGLGINENVTITDLILRLRRLSYVKDCVITTPEENIEIGINQIARFDDIEITLVQV